VRTVNAEEVRIPREAREAVAGHEEVVVLNRERPVFVIVNPEDFRLVAAEPRRGRPLNEVLSTLAEGPPPDPGFADDMQAVLESVGAMPESPWERC
jgi:PHD/YefM family antitoxin component YafN of YafNO toxin-antitoxin module